MNTSRAYCLRSSSLGRNRIFSHYVNLQSLNKKQKNFSSLPLSPYGRGLGRVIPIVDKETDPEKLKVTSLMCERLDQHRKGGSTSLVITEIQRITTVSYCDSPPKWLKFKRLTAPSAGEGRQQLECSYCSGEVGAGTFTLEKLGRFLPFGLFSYKVKQTLAN